MAAVRGAEEAGASDVPEAALHMKLAQEQIDRAKKLMEDDDNLEAEELAVRANQDAELALALARENQSKQRLQQFASTSQTAGGESGAMPAAPANTNPNPTAKP
jgi:pyridoxal biosynthesis lyase PdxS